MSLSVRHYGGFVALAFLAANCAPTRVRVADPVGPAPVSVAHEDMGKLVVFTQMSSPSEADSKYVTRSPYAVFDAHGNRIAIVTSEGSVPKTIGLSAGDYVVRASAFGRPKFDIGVRIVAGRTTEVHLEDAEGVPVQERTASAIYGPNGAFVGWRAGRPKR